MYITTLKNRTQHNTTPLHSTLTDALLIPHTLFPIHNVKVEPEDMVGPVIVAKGESFKDIVINNTKDVFVEFYAPW